MFAVIVFLPFTKPAPNVVGLYSTPISKDAALSVSVVPPLSHAGRSMESSVPSCLSLLDVSQPPSRKAADDTVAS